LTWKPSIVEVLIRAKNITVAVVCFYRHRACWVSKFTGLLVEEEDHKEKGIMLKDFVF